MNKLNIMIGIPGSGKTTYAKNNLIKDNVIYLSSDDIRKKLYGFEDQTHNEEVFELMRKNAKEALINEKDVIYDATNLSKKKRVSFINEIHNIKKDIEINAYMCCTPINILLERNITRTERKIPWEKFTQMIKSIEVPMYYEGFDNIYLIDCGMYNDIYDYNIMMNRCKNFEQDNPYHEETLEEHIKAVVKKASKNVIFPLNDRLILINAAKYHDFGKLYTKQYNDKKGYCVYYEHEKVSAYIYLCHLVKNHFQDVDNGCRLWDSGYQTACLILNHMEWYKRDDMSVIEDNFKDKSLFHLLDLLHQADLWGRNKNAK